MTAKKKYIIMGGANDDRTAVGRFQTSGRGPNELSARLGKAFPQGAHIPVTTSAVDDRVSMLEMSDEEVEAFKSSNADVALHPVRTYRLTAVDIDSVVMASGPFAFKEAQPSTGSPYQIKVKDVNGKPIPNALVVVREWNVKDCVKVRTNRMGMATIGARTGLAEYVGVTPFSGYWSQVKRGVMASSGTVTFVLDALQPTDSDCLKYHYPSVQPQAMPQVDQGRIKVAVIDTGIDEHPDLSNVVYRTSHAQADEDDDVCDNGTGHGTHVAGIIGGNGVICGIAPNADLMSFRVFERGAVEVETLYIFEAVRAAVDQGADVINMSLGQQQVDAVLERAIKYAEARGVLVVAASGNDGHSLPCYPARYSEVVSVAAVGRFGMFPANSVHSHNSHRATGADFQDFVPGFSNHGKVDLAAPGVAVISTIGKDGYAALDGTSMACPVISGFAARLLEQAPELKGRERSPQRLNDLKQLLYKTCNSLGFGKSDVGSGLPR